MVLNVPIKNENSNLCGTGGLKIEGLRQCCRSICVNYRPIISSEREKNGKYIDHKLSLSNYSILSHNYMMLEMKHGKSKHKESFSNVRPTSSDFCICHKHRG